MEFIDTFYEFLNSNNIDVNSDPEVIYFMAEQFPQNHDFLDQYGAYLLYRSDIEL